MKYKVLLTESVVHSIVVEANSEGEAASIAYDVYNEECFAEDYKVLSEGITDSEILEAN